MSKIRILPEHLANQIAAGEVIERPASVVKELVENSLDSGADRIEIDIEGSGTRLIRVVDNGEGMDEDDLLLCLERHGTSKITSDSGLATITTLGFRGEALPSIASVSRMTITSRPADREFGCTVTCDFGTIRKVHTSGAGSGTSIEVANLFGNTPARRKFLKSARTEQSHIDDAIRNFCLANPGTSFTLRIDGRPTIRVEADTEPAQRLAALLNYAGPLLPVDSGKPKQDGITVNGYLVPPETQVPIAARLRLFVNGRAIRDRMLVHAVGEGLRSFLPKGRSPVGMLRITLPPEDIDVNVHPAKLEVRFRDSRTVHQFLSEAVREAMLSGQQHLRQEIFRPAAPAGLPPTQQQPGMGEKTRVKPPIQTDPEPVVQTALPLKRAADSVVRTEAVAEPRPPYRKAPAPQSSSAAPEEPAQSLRVEELQIIGTFLDLYIFCRNGNRLVVIDQHAAHERLLFERFRQQYRSGTIASQNLLFPQTVELSPQQAQLLEHHLDLLEQTGFSIRHFGGNTWVVAAVPALAGHSDGRTLLFNLLERFGSERERPESDRLDDILASMACKSAVKAGDALTGAEISALLEEMAAAELFSHCPHGRPVVKIFETSEIKKWFHRS